LLLLSIEMWKKATIAIILKALPLQSADGEVEEGKNWENHSWSSVSAGSTNQTRIKNIQEKNYVCTEHAQTFYCHYPLNNTVQ
jgi:hypothetical protein